MARPNQRMNAARHSHPDLASHRTLRHSGPTKTDVGIRTEALMPAAWSASRLLSRFGARVAAVLALATAALVPTCAAFAVEARDLGVRVPRGLSPRRQLRRRADGRAFDGDAR